MLLYVSEINVKQKTNFWDYELSAFPEKYDSGVTPGMSKLLVFDIHLIMQSYKVQNKSQALIKFNLTEI